MKLDTQNANRGRLQGGSAPCPNACSPSRRARASIRIRTAPRWCAIGPAYRTAPASRRSPSASREEKPTAPSTLSPRSSPPFWGIGLILAILISILLARSISRPVKLVSFAMAEFAKGDLTFSSVDGAARDRVVARGDELGELGRSLQSLRESKKVVGGIRASSNEVSRGSLELSTSARSHGASEQAASIEELSASSSSWLPRSGRTRTTPRRRTLWLVVSRRTRRHPVRRWGRRYRA